MTETGEISAVAQLLQAARQHSGWSREQAAHELGWTRATRYQHYETRYKKSYLPPEIMQLVLRWAEEDPSNIPAQKLLSLAPITQSGFEKLVKMTREPTGNVSPAPDAPPPPDATTPVDVPVLGLAQGGPDGFIEMNDGAPIDRVRRPLGIANNRRVFAIYVAGDSMEPRYRPGELVYVNPNRPPRVGDYVVVEFKPLVPGDPHRAFIKLLRRRTPTKLVLAQHNPPKEIEYENDEIARISYVIDWNELLGV